MSDDLLFPQHGDEPDAAFFAALGGTIPNPGFIESGLEFTNIDYANLTFDVARGKAYIVRDSMTTASSDVDPAKTLDDVIEVVQFEGTSGIDLTDGQVNEIYLDGRVDTDDSPQILVNPSVTDDMLKIGEIDTSADTASEQWYLSGHGTSLTFPSEAALDEAAASLREGTLVYDRAGDKLYRVN